MPRSISCCPRARPAGIPTQQLLATANCLAQADAFAFGYSREQAAAELAARKLAPDRIELLARHKVHAGNRPVSIVAFERLDARTLGSLVALYEHKVFTQSVIWGINAFDQWGVELGKKMCDEVLPLVRDPGTAGARPMLKPLLIAPAGLARVMLRTPRRAVSRHWIVLAALLASPCQQAAADAGWFESGDTRLRTDLQLLNDAEVIRAADEPMAATARSSSIRACQCQDSTVAMNTAVAAALERVRGYERLRPARGDWRSILASAAASPACGVTSTRWRARTAN